MFRYGDGFKTREAADAALLRHVLKIGKWALKNGSWNASGFSIWAFDGLFDEKVEGISFQ